MVSETLRFVLGIGVVIYFLIIAMLLKYKAISLKYTLLWLFAGAVMLLFVIFPGMLRPIIQFFGVANEMYGLFAALIAFIIMILMSLTSIVSKQAGRIRELVQTEAMLEQRIRELESRMPPEESVE